MKYFYIAVMAALFVNIFHPYLWGPDEPREAEIARETFLSGNYVTPHFCGQPFLEKPPLYYDAAAALFHITGTEQGAARLISALLGALMLLTATAFAFKFMNERTAALTAAILLAMPQFYRAGHWILLDIGVGAFCVCAFTAFAFYAFGEYSKKGGNILLTIFYISSAMAFLTKGMIAVFYIVLVCGAFVILRRKWKLLKGFLATPG